MNLSQLEIGPHALRLRKPAAARFFQKISGLAKGATMSAIMHNDWLTTAEAAQHLKVSKQWLEKLRCWGGGPKFSLLGRCVRYLKSELDAWAISRERTSTSGQGSPDDEQA